MAINASFTGRTYSPTAPYAVGRENIREFAEAVGADNVMHTDQAQARARGYRDVIAPPTFAVLIAQKCERQFIVDPEAGINFSRLVHGAQRFVHHRPITAGDEIVGVLTIDSVKEVGGHAMVTTSSELSTIEGEPVCTATSTVVIRGGE
jgi:acyl dehydratase